MIQGNPNSLETIAKCEPAEPLVHIVPSKSERIGLRVVIPASSTIKIFPVALSNKLITSSIVWI